MKFGYARISTKKEQEKSLETQIQRLEAFGCDPVFAEQLSATSNSKPQFNHMMMKLRKGDTVCVTRLDRLDRRVLELIKLINDLEKEGVNFICLDQSIDTSTAIGRMMLNMLASFAQMEREVTIERVNTGLAQAKLKGIKFGRKVLLNPEQRKTLLTLKEAGDMSVNAICDLLKVSRPTFYRVYREEKARKESV